VASGAAKCLTDRAAITVALERAGIPPIAIATAHAAASDQVQRLESASKRTEALSGLVERVQLLPKALRLTLRLALLLPGQGDKVAGAGSPTITSELALHIKRRGVEMRLVIEDLAEAAPRVDTNLLKEIGRAYRCFDALLTGKVTSFSELPGRERIDERYVRRILPLAFLAPDIVRAIVAGTHPVELTAKQVIRRTALPLEWRLQKQVLGFR